MKRFISSLVLVAGLLPLNLNSASAIYGGTLAIGDSRVVKIWGGNNFEDGCSAALLTPQIVVSAAHCTDHRTPHEGTAYTTSEFIPAKQWWASVPGVDSKIDDRSTRVQVVKAYVTQGYKNLWPCTVDGCTQDNDLVFYILEKPLVESYSMPIATEADVAQVLANQMEVTHIGYGFQGDVSSPKNNDGKPYKIPGRILNNPVTVGSPPKPTKKIVRSEQSPTQSLCPGDSGSPVYVNINGVEKFLAVQFAGSGLCTGLKPGQIPSSSNTLAFHYIDLLRSEPLAASLVASYDKDAAVEKAAVEKATVDKVPPAVIKKTTISCIKGKLTKKVIAVAPKCPAGYKKK
jgi:hypothetical protein